MYVVSNRNKYKESFWGVKVWPVRKTDNLTAIYEPDFLENVGYLTCDNLTGQHGLLQR
jgi:hypothetical protein